MHIRRGDDPTNPDSNGSHPFVQIDRKIPLWGILGVVGTIAIHGTTLWFSNQTLAQKVVDLAAEVRALTAANHQAAIDRNAVLFKIESLNSIADGSTKRMDDLSRRISDLEQARRSK